jgi:hypothetical protein
VPAVSVATLATADVTVRALIHAWKVGPLGIESLDPSQLLQRGKYLYCALSADPASRGFSGDVGQLLQELVA